MGGVSILLCDRGKLARPQDTPRVDDADSRRSFLLGTVCALSGALSARWFLHSQPDVSPRWLRQLVPRPEPAASIGRSYLEVRSGEASRSWLVDRLLGADLPDTLGVPDLAIIRRRLRALRSSDLRSGDLVFIDGWALTRTEARLMALVALCVTS